MKIFTVEVTGTSREVYRIQAESPEEARHVYESNIASGSLHPVTTEIFDTEIERVDLYDES